MANLLASSGIKPRIWVAGHRGMVGSAIVRRLASEDAEVLTVDRRDVDLREQEAVRQFVARTKPDVIVMAAATVGGILANDSYPADFLFDNLAIETNVIHAAHLAGVERLVFLGSSCIYPKFAPQPIKEAPFPKRRDPGYGIYALLGGRTHRAADCEAASMTLENANTRR